MDDRRRFIRLQEAKGKSAVYCNGVKEDVKIIDVSAGGMKAAFSKPLSIGEDIYGKLHVLPEVGPFFVRGKVARVMEKDGAWETAVKFEKVSTLPFLVMNMYQMA